jgi:hypothetical protein
MKNYGHEEGCPYIDCPDGKRGTCTCTKEEMDRNKHPERWIQLQGIVLDHSGITEVLCKQNRERGQVPLENLIKTCQYPHANNCQECSICTLGKTFKEVMTEEKKSSTFSAPDESVYALRAHQILKASFPELTQMLKDLDLGMAVRKHFASSGTSMILKSDIKHLLD